MDIFQKSISPKRTKFARDFHNFNKREFTEEIGNIDWSDIIDVSNGTEKLPTFLSENRKYPRCDHSHA